MNRWFHRAVRSDLREAASWYELQRDGLGQEFLKAVALMLGRLEDAPRQFPKIEGELRRALLDRFPYQILYVVREAGRLEIFAVLHCARNPQVWKSRR